jgi:hypothetical protein
MNKPKPDSKKSRRGQPEKELTEEEIREVERRIIEVRSSPEFIARMALLDKKRQQPYETKTYSCHYNNHNGDPIFEGDN